MAVKKKGKYERQIFDLIGVVLERIKTTVYRHGPQCQRKEPSGEESTYEWNCVRQGFKGVDGNADPASCYYKSYYYQLRVRLEENLTDQVLAYKEYIMKHGSEKIWRAIEDKHYIDKRLLFECHRQGRDYKLVGLKEINK